VLERFFTTQFKRDLFYSLLFLLCFYVITHNPITEPMPKRSHGTWSIERLQHPILFGLAGHNYLVLRDTEGNVVAELHGLATDAITGEWKYIGKEKGDMLKVWEFDTSRYPNIEPNFPGLVVANGDESQVMMLWNRAMGCAQEINDRDIPYPTWGFDFRGITENSNSVAYTLSRCMGISTRHLGIFTPGGTIDLLQK
jgi:hypothetical protein